MPGGRRQNRAEQSRERFSRRLFSPSHHPPTHTQTPHPHATLGRAFASLIPPAILRQSCLPAAAGPDASITDRVWCLARSLILGWVTNVFDLFLPHPLPSTAATAPPSYGLLSTGLDVPVHKQQASPLPCSRAASRGRSMLVTCGQYAKIPPSFTSHSDVWRAFHLVQGHPPLGPRHAMSGLALFIICTCPSMAAVMTNPGRLPPCQV